MAKVTGPLFSVEGTGKLGEGICFTRSLGGARVILNPTHKDAYSALQSVQRSSFITGKSMWKALSAASKAYYNTLAADLAMTGYNFYLKKVLLGQIGGPGWVYDSWNGQVAYSEDDILAFWWNPEFTAELPNEDASFGRLNANLKRFGSGMRWRNVTIPKGATILTAHVHLRCSLNHAVTGVLARIIGDLEANAAVFSDFTDYRARRGTSCGGANNTKRTVAEVDYTPEDTWVKDVEYTTPDISAVIKEIVDQAGWASGNALALFIDDHDERTLSDGLKKAANSFNGSAEFAPKLHITYKYFA